MSLSGIPARNRRQLAGTLGLFAVLFVVVAAVSATGTRTSAAPVFAVLALVVAVALALVGWGVLHSVRLDAAEARLDEAIEQAIAEQGIELCACGHTHDPDELHVTDAEPCAHDGTGATCSHDCPTCVLAALRPSQSE